MIESYEVQDALPHSGLDVFSHRVGRDDAVLVAVVKERPKDSSGQTAVAHKPQVVDGFVRVDSLAAMFTMQQTTIERMQQAVDKQRADLEAESRRMQQASRISNRSPSTWGT